MDMLVVAGQQDATLIPFQCVVQVPRASVTGLEVVVSARNDASKRFVLRRVWDDFERLHGKLGKPKRHALPKKGTAPAQQCEQLTSYLRSVLSDAALAAHKEDVRAQPQLVVAGPVAHVWGQCQSGVTRVPRIACACSPAW